MIEGVNIEEVEMTSWSCCSCGVLMSMPSDFNDMLRKSHQTFYCLNGHGNAYSKKTDIEEIEDKLISEYAKNAQLEAKIKELGKSFLNRIMPPKK